MLVFPHPNTITAKILHLLTTSISPTQLLQIQAQIILHNLHPNPTITFHFINACKSLGLLQSTLHLFSHFQISNPFIYNNLIRTFSHSPSPQFSLLIYTQMRHKSIPPNHYTFPFVLKSLSDLRELRQGQTVHTHIVKMGHLDDLYVRNALLDLYSSCGEMEMCEFLFDEMTQRDAVSWTILISGHRKNGKLDEALIAFERMQYAGISPNRVTMVNALAACAGHGALEMGVWIHDYIKRNGWELDVILGTSLIDMYGKCGRIEIGLSVFDSMAEKNVYTWNSIIGGLALAKNGEEALSWFFRMEEEGIKPDKVSLTGVLCACSHSGLVKMGQRIFYSMVDGKYGFPPEIKHYGCMVDLLARAGLIDEAKEFMLMMPFEPNTVIWGALLSGCRAHGDMELSEMAARKLIELEPDNSAYYVVLSNFYAEMGRWSGVEEVRRLMKERGFKKDVGSSSVELEESKENVYDLLGP
ncbi:pentatricopeptide repeat-containing protein At5g66520-like [Magnolia sinica]|uniref:pentatricopeptide repeat-containing protein At5g66520-like n=1 Tax=Magnolia sinica TaxID=86752 RepID=UPI0026595211|nr:pentatricopeptide repeat-containing protein At5g66520-like [Magnolia sinica]